MSCPILTFSRFSASFYINRNFIAHIPNIFAIQAAFYNACFKDMRIGLTYPLALQLHLHEDKGALQYTKYCAFLDSIVIKKFSLIDLTDIIIVSL